METSTHVRMTASILSAALLMVLNGLAACSGAKNGSIIRASGTIEAREVNVASKVGGQIREIKADEGSRVKMGDVLALIDHEMADIQLRQAEAGAMLASAQLDLVRKGARIEDIKQGEEALKQADANLKVAEDDAARMRELAAKGSVTTKQKDDAEARLIVTRAQQAQAGEGLRKLRQMSRPEEVRAAEARLAQAQASVDLLKKSISDGTIISPADGVVTRRPVEAGELVIPGATVLTVSELDSVHVMIYVTEKDLGLIGLGREAVVTIDSAPGRTFKGRVTYISSEAEFTPKNVQTREDRVKLVFGIKIEVPNPEGLLKPGMPADAVLAVVRTASR